MAAVEKATAEWVGWFNNKRVHSALDYDSPADFEGAYWDNTTGIALRTA